MNTLAERGKGLEDAFFAQQDAMLRQKLAALDDDSSKVAALSQASGITDAATLERLAKLGVSSATVAALALVPLVTIAWSDGTIDEKERAALLAAADRMGLDATHPGHALFKGWLAAKPGPQLLAAWKSYVAALPAETRKGLATPVMGHARAVAEVAGGFFGLGGRISAAEAAALAEVEKALDHD